MSSEKKYVQYGCGLSCPDGWLNFDVSPTLRIQKSPLIGRILRSKLNVIFPEKVKYGNIIKGLPSVSPNSCDGVYSSHTLEHLSLTDFRKSLKNTLSIMKSGAIFRCVMPDLEHGVRLYLEDVAAKRIDANHRLMKWSEMGHISRPTNLFGFIKSHYSSSRHLYLWDELSLQKELEDAGFVQIRRCVFADCEDQHFQLVESKDRFENALAFECIKP